MKPSRGWPGGRQLWRRGLPFLAGALAGLVSLAVLVLDLGGIARPLKLATGDLLTRILPLKPSGQVVVVDIDRPALAALGPWPWPRAVLADLVEAIVAARPASLAVDILLGPRPASEADAEQRIARALAQVPSALGIVLDPEAGDGGVPPATLALRGRPALLPALTGLDVSGPSGVLETGPRGFGLISLPGGVDGIVRAVPLIGAAGSRPYLGLAVEGLRLAREQATVIIDGDSRAMLIGPHRLPLPEDGLLPLAQSWQADWSARTVQAAALVADPPLFAERLAGRMVILGASAPEAGGLRATPYEPLTPSAQIQADALEQMALGYVRMAPDRAGAIATGAGLGLLLLGLLLLRAVPPALALFAMTGLCVLWAAACAALHAAGTVLDPLGPPLSALIGFQTAAVADFARVRRERQLIERRFAQHLSAKVVARIAENPDRLRLDGEERMVTALFTDIEGFTALTERVGPRELVSLLDAYLDRMCALVLEHGGMVDKVVGDAIHAFFNAPVDLPDHAVRALDCARAMALEAERFRAGPQAAAAGFGRTRFGLETGPAIVGDVGGGRRLDYTAHGRAINLAARLEAANKRFGSTIAVGPGTVAAAQGRRFRALGTIEPFAGAEPVPVSEPVFD